MLNRGLCPWLGSALEHLESAHAQQRLGHAWLIHGAEGIGKTNLAMVFATRLLENDRTGRPEILSAQTFLEAMRNRHEAHNHHPDLHWLYPEPGKRSISVEQVRDVCGTLELSGYSGAARVAIIEPAEAMTTSAANALLKTLEEPTPASYLLLVSHRPGVLPATVRSRCQQLRIRPPEDAALLNWAQPAVDMAQLGPPGAPDLTPLQLLESLDEDGGSTHAERTRQLADVLSSRGNPVQLADEWSKGDADHSLAWLIRVLHSLIRLRCVGNASKLVTESPDVSLHNAASTLSLRSLFDQLDEAERLRGELAGGINVQLAMRALMLGFVSNKGIT